MAAAPGCWYRLPSSSHRRPSFSSPKTKFCEQRVARLIDRVSPLAKNHLPRHRTRVVNIGTATRMRGEGESVQRYRRLASTIAVFPC
jgi:hypothetical protein